MPTAFHTGGSSRRQTLLQAACLTGNLVLQAAFLTVILVTGSFFLYTVISGCSGLVGRPHSAMPSSTSAEGRELQQLNDRMGEVERLHSIVASDAAAMKAMGVLVEAKALKLDVHGKAYGVSRSVGNGTLMLLLRVAPHPLRRQSSTAICLSCYPCMHAFGHFLVFMHAFTLSLTRSLTHSCSLGQVPSILSSSLNHF